MENIKLEPPAFALNEKYIKTAGIKGIKLYTYLLFIFLNKQDKLNQDQFGCPCYKINNNEIMRVCKVSQGIAIRLKKKLNKTDLVKFYYDKGTNETLVYLKRYE